MKLSSPFTVLKNVISDIRRMHDFSYKLPPETHDEFWEKECADHPTASTCKTYEEQINGISMSRLSLRV